MSSSINIRLVAAIVAASVLTGCSRPGTARDERDAALAANVDAFATKLAASDEFSGVVLLLGAIIERRTGRAFTSIVEAELFRPLGLASTRYEVGGSPKPALGYTRTPPAGARADSARWYPAWEEPKPGDDCIPCTPMGGGYSTADDLARFADALVDNRILNREMTTLVLNGYINADYGGRDGYGFETRLVNGVKIAGHRGALAGSSNQVEFYPELGYVVVVLGNTDSGTAAIAAHVRALLTSPAAS